MRIHDIHGRRRTCLRFTASTAFVLAGCQLQKLEALSVVYAQATGNWTTAANWSPAQVPTSNDSAFIRMSRVVTLDSNAGSVINIQLGENDFGGTLLIDSGAALNVTGVFNVMRPGNFSNIDGTLTMGGGTLTVAGGLLVGAGNANNSGSNSGTASFSGGTFTGTVTVGSAVGTSIGNFNVIGSAATLSGSTFTANAQGRMLFDFGATGVSMLTYATAGFASGSTFSIDGSDYSGAGGDITLVDSSALNWNVQPGDVSISGFNGFTTQLLTTNNDVVLRLTAVPEPSALLLLLAGTPLLAWRHRRDA